MSDTDKQERASEKQAPCEHNWQFLRTRAEMPGDYMTKRFSKFYCTKCLKLTEKRT